MNIVRELFTSDPAALWRALISSTVLLASGLAAGALLRRRPPHAHQALGLAIACALLAPAATELVRRSGLGLLAARDPAAALVPAGVATAPPDEDAAGESARAGDSTAAAAGPASTRAFGVFAGAPSVPAPGQLRQADEDLTAQPAGPARSRVDWSAWGLAAWAGTSLLILVRGMLAWRRARLLASRAQTVGDDTLRRALARATQRAQLARAPRLASSGDITCPVVWAWSRQPLLIVPQATVGGGAVELDWEAVFAHELAHLQRRDHLPQALASLLCALLPWHPLTWFARARLTRWAELACDDRVLEAGHPAAGYAETLLAFVPAARNPWIAAAVTRGTALRGRLKRILEDAPTPSRVTTGWRRVALAFAALATMAVACAQPGRAVAASDTVAETDAPPGAPQSGTAIAGDVASGDGRPVLGARVELFLQEPPGPAATLVATLLTDEQGRFALEDGRDDGHWWLRVSAPGFGQQWLYRAESANGETPTPTHVVLLPAQRLAGTVVNEEGAPVPGVMLTLSTEFPEDDPHRSLPRSPDHAHRTSTQTDAEGRFAFDQLQGRTVALMLEHSDYSQTMSPDSPRVETGQQDVRLVIQRGLTLHGVVTADGKPIAGVALHTSAPNLSKRPLGHWDIVTDAEGRFEIRGISTLLSRGVASSIATPLIALSVETPEWTSPMYRVFDRYGPELSFVTIEATRRQQPPAVPGSTQDPASGAQPGGRPPSIDVDFPTNGALARIHGDPVGTASAIVTLQGAVRFHGRSPTLYLGGKTASGTGVDRSVDVDDAGRALFDQLPAGEYAISTPNFQPPSYPTARFVLQAGEARQVTIEPAPNRVHGRITCGGKPVTAGDIDIIALHTDPPGAFHQGAGAVHDDGTWEATGVPVGRYRFTFDGGYGHSVPNHVFADVAAGETVLDIALPQTRIDVSIEGRALAPDDYERQEAMGMESTYDLQVYPAGSAPMGGNTAGNISVKGGDGHVEHVPPGRWTIRTSDTELHRYAATVELSSDTAHVRAVLRRTDIGSGSVTGKVQSGELSVDVHGGTLAAYPKPPAGLDVTQSCGAVQWLDGAYRMTGLQAGTYGLFVSPPYDLLGRHADPEFPFLYVPDVRVEEGTVVTRDFAVPAARNVLIRTLGADGQPRSATWRLNLGGDDWLPFHLFVGSEPRALVAIPRAFPLAVGEHRLETTVLGQPPRVHTIRVEAGTGVQTIDVPLDG